MGKKWNRDASPAEKMLSLYSLLLFTRHQWSLTKLAETLNCSKQTVCRLIDQLEASVYGKVIRTQKGREAFYHLDRPQDAPCLSLDAEGLELLALCRDFVLHLLPESFRKRSEGALRLASSFTSQNEATALEPLPPGYALHKGRIDYQPHQETIQTLMAAIRTSQVCSLVYKSGPAADPRSFEFAPLRVIAYNESIRILGWMVTDQGPVEALYDSPAILPLHRIQTAALTQRKTGKLPKAPEPSPEVFGLMSGEAFTAIIKFQARAAAYASERQWSSGQKIEFQDDGAIIVELETGSELELIAWVLSFGDAAELLSPQWLRQKMADKIRGLNQIYLAKHKSC